MTEPMADVDWAEEAPMFAHSSRSRLDWMTESARWLSTPDDRVLVDLGCGGGEMAVALARQAPTARVVAIDGTPEMLRAAGAAAERAGVADRIDLRSLDLHHGVAGLGDILDGGADLIWAAGVVHHLGDQQSTVDGLAAALRPGGRLALAEGGLEPRHLPWDIGVGEPGLEGRTEHARNLWFQGMRVGVPGTVRMPYGWTEALRRAGLVDVGSRAFLQHQPAPLDPADLDVVLGQVGALARRLRPTGLLAEADQATWDRILDPADEAWLGHRTDLFTLSVNTVFVGTRTAP